MAVLQNDIDVNFNPRSPQGERPNDVIVCGHTRLFQSTLPAGGATESPVIINPVVQFQSTLPAGGATETKLHLTAMVMNFNPRSPQGERRE